jgi:hypothetical protein
MRNGLESRIITLISNRYKYGDFICFYLILVLNQKRNIVM